MALIESIFFIGRGVATIWIGLTLIRQGHPEDKVDRDLPEDPDG